MKQCTVTHYAEEFKASSAKLAVELSQAISQTARELGAGLGV
jgi:transposase-like protein